MDENKSAEYYQEWCWQFLIVQNKIDRENLQKQEEHEK